MRSQKEPLYRRVNTRARGVNHGGRGEYRWSRHARKATTAAQGAMDGRGRNGLDYTPLFRFLLSRVGADWTDTYREAAARLDRPDPIFWMVARTEAERQPSVRIGESAFYSGLFVDGDNRLTLVDPDLGVESMEPGCACCTYTFNGARFTRPFETR